MITSKQLTRKFGSKTAVNAVDLELEPGHVYAMLGPNGYFIIISNKVFII